MQSPKHFGLVLVTVAISMFVNLGCAEDVQGPEPRSQRQSNRSLVWVTLSGTVRSFETGEPVGDVQVAVYRITSADRPNVKVTGVQTNHYGKYNVTFSHACDGTRYGLEVRRAGSPNLFPREASERIWPLPDDLCRRSKRTVDIKVVGLES